MTWPYIPTVTKSGSGVHNLSMTEGVKEAATLETELKTTQNKSICQDMFVSSAEFPVSVSQCLYELTVYSASKPRHHTASFSVAG